MATMMLRIAFLLTFLATYVLSERKIANAIMDRIEMIEYDKYYMDLKLRVDKINKTSYAINTNMTCFHDLPDLTFKGNFYGLFSNAYKLVPITINRRICEIFNFEYKWVQKEVMKVANLPTECPIRKGNYYIRNYIPDTTKFPFESPWDQIKIRFWLFQTHSKATIILFDLYCHLDRASSIINSRPRKNKTVRPSV